MNGGEDYWVQFGEHVTLFRNKWRTMGNMKYIQRWSTIRISKWRYPYKFYADITEDDAYTDFMKLGQIRWNEVFKEVNGFQKATESRITYIW
jgi:hypothetical protein